MVSYKKVSQQLKDLGINASGWGHGEYRELCNVLMPDEVIQAGVNGYYEAGFALLVVTKNRMLIIDKKPLNYLTVEDMRYDMINEFDYQHRLFGAQIKISAGAKTLHFTSLNQVRLRRCMSYVQMRMTEIKAEQDTQQEDQKRHLEQMNKQLEMYLQLQQLQQQQYLQQQKLGGVGQPDYIIQMATAAEPSHAIPASFDANYTPQQIGFGAMKRVVPVISAYTRLPLISKQRRLQNTPQQARLTAE